MERLHMIVIVRAASITTYGGVAWMHNQLWSDYGHLSSLDEENRGRFALVGRAGDRHFVGDRRVIGDRHHVGGQPGAQGSGGCATLFESGVWEALMNPVFDCSDSKMMARWVQWFCLLTFAFCVSHSTVAEDSDLFGRFDEVGVLNPALSDQTVRSKIRAGVASQDPEVIDSTIRSLGMAASRVAHADLLSGPPPPSRSFAEVDGLKEFLISHWHEQYERSGYDPSASLLKEMDRPDDVGDQLNEDLWSARERGDHEAAQAIMGEISSRAAEIVFSRPAWPMIPQILCVYWPGDTDVERLLWYIDAHDQGSNPSLQVLGLLNTGGFDTPRANAYRISQIQSAAYSDEEGAQVPIRFAAEGLLFSPVSGAVPLLVDAGLRHYLARGEVLRALAAYPDDELLQHADGLRSLLQLGVPSEITGDGSQAHERLSRLLRVQGDDAGSRDAE